MANISFQGQGALKISSAAATVSALTDAAEENLSISDSDAAVGDIVLASLDDAGMETGLAVIGAWVSAAGTIKVRISNVKGSALTGGSRTVRYALLRA